MTGGTKYDHLIPDVIRVHVTLRENLFFCGYVREQENLNISVTLFILLCVCVCPGIVRVSRNCTSRHDICQEFAEDFMS